MDVSVTSVLLSTPNLKDMFIIPADIALRIMRSRKLFHQVKVAVVVIERLKKIFDVGLYGSHMVSVVDSG